jgi:hypothetical protein
MARVFGRENAQMALREMANEPAGGNARSALQFPVARHWPGVLRPGC